MKTFRIICLKRSKIINNGDFDYLSDWYKSMDLVYWKSDCSGYTRDIKEAGLYKAEELLLCGGGFLDWIAEPTW